MKIKSPSLFLSLAVLLSGVSGAQADGTYVYSDGSTKDVFAGVPVPAPAPIPMKEAKWYLRLDIGGSTVGNVTTDVIGQGVDAHQADEIPTSIFGEVGFGYQFNKNFRMDFTSSFHDSYALTDSATIFYSGTRSAVEIPSNDTLTNVYDAERTDRIDVRNQSTNLVNFYFDVDNGSRFTPYFGAGVGVTYINTRRRYEETATCREGIRDDGVNPPVVTPGACHADAGADTITTESDPLTEEEHEWLFSGALMAGFSYDFNEYVSVDAGYRLLYSPGTITRTAETFNGQNQASWDDFLHHQFRTGLRINVF